MRMRGCAEATHWPLRAAAAAAMAPPRAGFRSRLSLAPARNSPRSTPLGRPRVPCFCSAPALPDERLRASGPVIPRASPPGRRAESRPARRPGSLRPAHDRYLASVRRAPSLSASFSAGSGGGWSPVQALAEDSSARGASTRRAAIAMSSCSTTACSASAALAQATRIASSGARNETMPSAAAAVHSASIWSASAFRDGNRSRADSDLAGLDTNSSASRDRDLVEIEIKCQAIAQRRRRELIFQPFIQRDHAETRRHPQRKPIALDDGFPRIHRGGDMHCGCRRQSLRHRQHQDAAIGFREQPALGDRPARKQRRVEIEAAEQPAIGDMQRQMLHGLRRR